MSESRVQLRTNSEGVLIGVRLEDRRSTSWLTAREARNLACELIVAAEDAEPSLSPRMRRFTQALRKHRTKEGAR